jgi:hypothetical protein
MKKYIVVNSGEVVFVSDSEEEAEAYAEAKTDEAIDNAAEEMGVDLDNIDQAWRAQFQAGYDGGTYDVGEIDTDDFNEDDEMDVELSSGEEVTITLDDIEKFDDINE